MNCSVSQILHVGVYFNKPTAMVNLSAGGSAVGSGMYQNNFLLFLQLSGNLLELVHKGWDLMNKQDVGVSRHGPSLANQNLLHGEICGCFKFCIYVFYVFPWNQLKSHC